MKVRRHLVVVVYALLAVVVVVFCAIASSFVLIPKRSQFRYDITSFPFVSGDLLLVTTDGSFGKTGRVLSCISGFSAYNHVAVVYKHPETGNIFIWECQARIYSRAALLVPLARFVRKFKGRVFVRPLFRRAYGSLTRATVNADKFHEVIASLWHYRYRYDYYSNVWNRIFFFLPLPFVIDGVSREKMYCTELVALTYARLGVFLPSPRSTSASLLPGDFGEHRRDTSLPMNPRFAFGREIELTLPHATTPSTTSV